LSLAEGLEVHLDGRQEPLLSIVDVQQIGLVLHFNLQQAMMIGRSAGPPHGQWP
jgi:hypothetical protein